MALIGKKPLDSFNRPISFSVKVNGTEIDTKYSFIKINTDKAINKISRAKIYISGGNASLHEFEQSEDPNFNPGKTVEISFGYAMDITVVFKGVIEKLGISLRDGYATKPWQSLLVLDCVDKAIKLTNTYTSDIYEKKNDSAIITTLLKKVSGLKSTVSATPVTHPYFPKYNSSDWEFILKRAQLNGMVVLNSNNEINVTKPYKTPILPELIITHGLSTVNFDAQINSGTQLNDLTYNSWDPFTNKTNKNKSSEPSLISNSKLTGKTLSKETSAEAITINIPQGMEVAELKALSDSKLLESRLSRITGRAKFKGVTNIDIGSVVQLDGFGKYFDGNIYVTAISHQIESGVFSSQIEFGLKKNYFNTESRGIDKSEITDKIDGIHLGTVKAFSNDPLNQGRVQVLIPSLKETGTGTWAKLSQFYTSNEAGAFFYPEIGTQVIISFIASDPRYPVIMGSLYTKTNTPYTKLPKDNSLKAFLSKNKLTLEFNDKDNEITISTPKKNSLVISEKEKSIIITDQNKNIIKTSSTGIALTSKKNIDITSSGAVTITGSKGVTISGKAGAGVKVSGSKVAIDAKTTLLAKGGSKAELTASGKVTIKGATVGIN